MTRKFAASLVGLVTKGAATPTPAVGSGTALTPAIEASMAAASTQFAKSAHTYHKSLTLKLDEERYRSLKLAGLELERSSQDILVEALDAWLSMKGGSHV